MSDESFLYGMVAGNPMEPLLRRLVGFLAENNYSASASMAYVRSAIHFGRWLGDRSITATLADQYLDRHLPHCRCEKPAPCDRRWNAGAIRHLLALAGIDRPIVEGIGDEILRRYREYLISERGLKPNSVRSCVYQAARTVTALQAKTAGDVSRWTRKQIQQHACDQMAGRAGSASSVIGAHLRVLLRYLHRERFTKIDLATAVPSVPFWRSGNLPPTVDRETVRQLLAAAAGNRTAQGLRNYAILLGLHELGMRASDLLSLQLDDLKLDQRTLSLRHAKGRRELVLPISRTLANAFKIYIARGRPVCKSPWVFVHHRAPAGKKLTTAGVSSILRKLALQSRLPNLVEGTHVFRRALAGRMLNAGATLKQIADVLGHRSINTTAQYARMDVKNISTAAMPWPATSEVRS